MQEATVREKKSTVDREVHALKTPPHSLEAEQSLLGGVLLDNEAWDNIAHTLTQADFYRYEHRVIFRALSELSEKNAPFDIVTLIAALKAHEKLDDAGGELYLYELANNTASVANIQAYAEIVRQRSVLRQLIAVANDIADTAFTPGDRAISELLDHAESKVFAIAEQTAQQSGPQTIKKVLAKAIERIDALATQQGPVTGLATGFTDFDKMTAGLQPAELIIVAGRPSMGKTTFAMNMAENALQHSDKPVLIFSMEMPADSLAIRMIASLGKVEQQRLRTGQLRDEDWPKITATVSALSSKKFFIDDTPGLSPSDLRARARRIVKEHSELGLIVVDYLQLMQVPGFRVENRVAEISQISRALKSLAKELNVPVIALSQLNRSLEQRSDRRPVMSDLRESGAIEQDADLIAFIYRDEVYHEDSPDKGIAEIIIGKQRNGPIGKVRLAFLGQYSHFDNLASASYEQTYPNNH